MEFCFIGKQSNFRLLECQIKEILGIDQVRFEVFNDSFFESIQGYNLLMLSSDFYRRFNHAEYILICQLDAFVIQRNLSQFIKKGYIYFGAPFLGIHNNTEGLTVGNGGFSLRKISFFEDFSNVNSFLPSSFYFPPKSNSRWWRLFIKPWYVFGIKIVAFLLRKDAALEIGRVCQINEDIIWSRILKKYNCKVPDMKVALQFSFDKLPETCFTLNKENLPFACHGFVKNNPRFWQKYIPEAFEGE